MPLRFPTVSMFSRLKRPQTFSERAQQLPLGAPFRRITANPLTFAVARFDASTARKLDANAPH